MNHLHASRPLRAALLALTCATGFALTACYHMPTQRGVTVETTSTGKLEKKNPIDVVMEPVENATGSDRVPIEELRAAFQLGLVKRHYSPLALELVDKHVVDDIYKAGALHEEADMHLKVETWNDSLWETHTALLIKAEARMIDAQDGTVLWTGKIDHRYEFGSYREKFSSDQALREFACKQIADEILSALPARTTSPGAAAPAH